MVALTLLAGLLAQAAPSSVSASVTDAELTACMGEPCTVVSVTIEVANDSDALVCIPAVYTFGEGIILPDAQGETYFLNNPGPMFAPYPTEASQAYGDGPQLIVQPRSRRTFAFTSTVGRDPAAPSGLDPGIDYRALSFRLLWRNCSTSNGGYEVTDLRRPLG